MSFATEVESFSFFLGKEHAIYFLHRELLDFSTFQHRGRGSLYVHTEDGGCQCRSDSQSHLQVFQLQAKPCSSFLFPLSSSNFSFLPSPFSLPLLLCRSLSLPLHVSSCSFTLLSFSTLLLHSPTASSSPLVCLFLFLSFSIYLSLSR